MTDQSAHTGHDGENSDGARRDAPAAPKARNSRAFGAASWSRRTSHWRISVGLHRGSGRGRLVRPRVAEPGRAGKAARTGADAATIDRLWQAYLRRIDLEHTFRFLKQTLGWTRPRLREPTAAHRWIWLTIAAHTQLRLARGQATDLRRPWERPADPQRLTPARARRGFLNIRATSALPAGAPKPAIAGPGRPPGSSNRRPATVQNDGKTLCREKSLGTASAQTYAEGLNNKLMRCQ